MFISYFGSSIKNISQVQCHRAFQDLQSYKFIMHHIESLYLQYQTSLSEEVASKAQTLLKEFKMFIESLGKMNIATPPKLKYSSNHLNFLLSTLSVPQQAKSVSFAVLIQILNILLRTSTNLRLTIPENLMQALGDHLEGNQQYQRSPSLISNVVWLVGRCIQLSRDRQSLVRKVSESSLISKCLCCPVLQGTAQRGISLLLAYMSKVQIIREQFTLKLIQHLHKFTQIDSIREILVLLRRISLPVLKDSKENISKLVIFFVNYMDNPTIPWQQKTQNWQLLFSLAHFDKSMIKPLCINELLKTLVDETSVEIEEELLNKVYDVSCSLIKKSNQELGYLAMTVKHIISNPIARRIFIHSHEKITPQLFIEILSGPLPAKLIQTLSNGNQKSAALKVLICLRRSSSLLGLEEFFNFKFDCLSVLLREENCDNSFGRELMDLWREVSSKKEIQYLRFS